MSEEHYTEQQLELISAKLNTNIWLSGKAGTGKTTAVTERIRRILDISKNYPNVLVFAPSRACQEPYLKIVSDDGICPEATTYNAYIQKSLNLFWPVVVKNANLKNKTEPLFLELESEQILLAKSIKDKIDSGYFGGISIPVSRVYNQILVAMHKCAAAMIPFSEYAEIMKSSWSGDKAMITVFEQAQECGALYSAFCKEHNILDYSSQIEYFNQYLLSDPVYRKWIKKQKIHFIYDNTEEGTPAAHYFVSQLSNEFQSMCLVYDENGGHRSFMGCDPYSALNLSVHCDTEIKFEKNFVCSPAVSSLETVLRNPKSETNDLTENPNRAFTFESSRQYAKMIKDASSDIIDMIQNRGVKPEDIVILSPLISDVLYTEMERVLREHGIHTYMSRPSKPLLNERHTKAFLTLCALVLPMSGYHVQLLDIEQMLQTFIEGIDPMRGQLYVSAAFKKDKTSEEALDWYDILPFSQLPLNTKQRIYEESEERLEVLRGWIEEQRETSDNTPDKLVYRFFNDILVRDGFISDSETNLGICKVLESMNKYNRILEYFRRNNISAENTPDWNDYFRIVSIGALKATYFEDIYSQPKNTILVSLVSSYLSMNRHDKYQIWLNVASPRWREKFNNELANDQILSRNWTPGSSWNALTEEAYNDAHMVKQACGLLNRCGEQVKAYASEMDEKGGAQRGKLLNFFAGVKQKYTLL